MILIIAHHYVVNSGINLLFDFGDVNANMVFLQFFGFAGKIGINCFLLITGYFMCRQEAKLSKFLKLYLEIKLYKFIFYGLFLYMGLEALSLEGFISNVFNIGHNQGSSSFAAVFVGLYLLSPFINRLLCHLSERNLRILLCVLLVLHTACSTFFFASTENLGWYITVYLIGSYIRLYPKKVFSSRLLWPLASLGLVLVAWVSIIVVDFVGPYVGFDSYYHMVVGSDKLFAIAIAICLFFSFMNMRMGYHKIVNTISATTFGVLLIHANSDTMRTFLWQIVFKVPQQYTLLTGQLVLHAISTVSIVYVVCVLIDLVRIQLLEKPFFSWLGRRYTGFMKRPLYPGLGSEG